MKRIVILLSSILRLFASCSAEIIGNLPYEEVRTDGETMDVQPVSGKSFSISFKPVPYATGYEYSLNGGASVPLTNITYDGSSYYAVIDVGESGSVTGTIDLFACTSDGSVRSISSTEYVLSLSNVAPDAYLAARNETSAEIRVNTSLPSGMVMYKVVLTDADGSSSQTLNFFSNSFEVTGLSSGSYTAEVSHALVGQEFGDKTTKVEIASYSVDDISTISLDVNENGFVASDIPDGVSSVRLIKYANASAEGTAILEDIPVEGSIVEVPFTGLRSLETGYFRIESSDGTAKSDVLKCTVPVVNAEVTVNYKSVFVDFSFSMDFDASHYDIYVIGVSSAKVDVAGNHVTISNLKSNYDFGNVLLCFRYKLKENEAGSSYVISCPVELKTKSFVGTYSWENTGGIKDAPSNFIIDVRNSEDGSEFPYYVYFNRNDEAVKGTANEDKALRIMPLLDPAAGDPDGESSPIPLTGVDAAYASANASYMANSGKWNTSSFTPTKWKIISNTFANAGDGVVTTTKSWASIFGAFEMDADTATGFYFMEYQRSDGTMLPVIKFKNIGTGTWANTVNSNLVKNTTPDNGKKYGETLQSEPDPKYCWYLEKID